MKKAIIIGGGFAGLTAASELAKEGLDVTLLEKNSQVGGRARQFEDQGFVFDMGPSWYWMPDVFENFFNRHGKSASDYFKLVQLDPGFQIIFNQEEKLALPAKIEEIHTLFENYEEGGSAALAAFLKDSKRKYDVAMGEFIYLPSHSIFEFASLTILKEAPKLDLLKGFDKYVGKYFKHPHLKALMEFPILFLGAKPEKIPAMYSMMNYSALAQGTWYPMGGMHKIIEGFKDVAESLGVKILLEEEVISFEINNQEVNKVITKNKVFEADTVIASADYHHIESILDKAHRNYNEKYWDKRTMSPSALIYYVGLNKQISRLEHHNLFFDSDFVLHAKEIYDTPGWPTDPQFYVCCPSKTDDSVAPKNCENLFFLMPIAPGIEDTPEIREKYFNLMIQRTEKWTGQSFEDDIIVKHSYCIDNFKADYHAYKGNAYGLANTLRQTAVLKPKMKNKKIKNLWYAGQLTVPGPGMPPSIISGQIAATEALKSIHIPTTT